MDAILIDPFTRTITPVQYDGDFHSIYKFIDCSAFDIVRVNDEGDAIFVDDEGLISDKEQEFFLFDGYPQPLAGKGLILGCDAEGESVAPVISIEEVRERVSFGCPVRFAGGGVGWLEFPAA